MTEALCALCARPLLRDAPCFACTVRAIELELPERIGPYPILREIGAGGMGIVYAGLQHCPAREVAIKVIKDGVFSDASLRERFVSEREIAGSFEHPNIIRVYDAGEDADGQLYYVMELAQRGTLRDFLRTESLSIRDAVRLIVEVALAVDCAHRRGVLHRDLKPDNILIGEDKRPRVTDFGVAHVLAAESGASTDQHALVGSYPYMAPEQAGYDTAAPLAAASPAADIYSLGAILYELVHGAPPYAVSTREELLRALAHGPPAPLLGLDYDLEAVIMRALAHAPNARYASAAELAEDLRRTLGRRPPSARSPSLRGRLVSTLSHHAAWFSILVAALAISAALVFALNQAMLRGPAQQKLGIAVATVALEKLAHEVEHPALALVAPREVELNDPRTTNVELVRVDHDPEGQLTLQPASEPARQLYIANVARTDYAITANLREPAFGVVWYGLILGVTALVALCLLALFLFRRARIQSAV